MKPDELMVGDYCRCGSTIVKVSRVSESSASGLDLSALDPIVVTRDILEKIEQFVKGDNFGPVSKNFEKCTERCLYEGEYGYIGGQLGVCQHNHTNFVIRHFKHRWVFDLKKHKLHDISYQFVFFHELQQILRISGFDELANSIKPITRNPAIL